MFADRLRELREDSGMRQRDLASLLNTSRTTITEYERGINEPNFEILIRIADIFNVTTDYLLGRTKERYHVKPMPIELSNKELISKINELINSYQILKK